MKEQITKAVTKLEFLSNVIAHSERGTMDMEGLYFIFTDVIDEIKKALDDVEDRPTLKAANIAA